jgi:hypothetical protein
MGRKLNTDEFIQKSNTVHKNMYDYSFVEYVNSQTKVQIKCKKHGIFKQIPNDHIRGSICSLCNIEKRSNNQRKSHIDFIAETENIYGIESFEYLEEYKSANIKISIKCLKCFSEFNRTPNLHLQGHGCPICSLRNDSKYGNLSFDEMTNLAINKFGNIYDYSKFDYKNSNSPSIIKCNICGVEFKQTFKYHIDTHIRCKVCSKRKSHFDFVKLVDVENFNLKTKYVDTFTKIEIECLKCKKIYIKTPEQIINNRICNKCYPVNNKSVGETLIREILLKNNLIFEEQKRFKECRNILPLPFDFYLPEYNICIEYDGIHHFKPVIYSNTDNALKSFELVKKRDKIKTKFCNENNIKLIRISSLIDVKNILNLLRKN